MASGGSQAGSGGSSRSSFVGKRERSNEQENDQGDNLLDRRSSLEYGIFGVLFTLSKEKSEHRIRTRWVLLKILLDGWQLFTTVVSPNRQSWNIDPNGTAWVIVGVLNFTWLADLGYSAYVAVLYSMLALLAVNMIMCVWVAWCFKEHKFPVVWPIKVLRVFSSVFFQAFDVASLNLLQLGITCRYTGPLKPHLHFDLFPQYSCSAPPHIMHAVVSALCLVLFIAIALLLNMAEVEVNPLSRRPMALGHSGAEVAAFAIKALMTLVNVFLGWAKVEASVYMALSLALAWQTLRWSSHLVAWVNYLKAGVSATVVWCSVSLMLLTFQPGVKPGREERWSNLITVLMLTGLAPAFALGSFLSWACLRHMNKSALKGLENPKKLPLMDAFSNMDEPRDVEIAARCCRVWKEPCTLDPEAVKKAHLIIKAGLEMFPNSAFMVLLHANFMIDVLGVSQSGSRRIEDARKLNPGLMCRFIMFVRQQQATQNAAGSAVSASMDLLGYVEYQRKQRMVVRLHREALQAMCNFWKALDASSVSFTHLSNALGKIESSVSQAQRAYRVVLESYGNNPKLVHLYGRFLQTIKNDPWHAAEYFAEAERLEELQDSNASGPLMPDGTPLSRMDEIDTAVLVLNANGEVQMANRHTQHLFGYKRGVLEGKPLSTLLAPHYARRLADRLAAISSSHELLIVSGLGGGNGGGGGLSPSVDQGPGSELGDEQVVGLHCDRLAFPAKLSLCKASGVGEDSTIIALIEPVQPEHGVSSVWVTHNGIVTAVDPSFVINFGWKAGEVNGTSIKALITAVVPKATAAEEGRDVWPKRAATASQPPEKPEKQHRGGTGRQNGSASELIKRLLAEAAAAQAAGAAADAEAAVEPPPAGVSCLVPHKYMRKPVPCTLTIVQSASTDAPIVHELRIRTDSEPLQLLAVNRKGAILHASSDIAAKLRDRSGDAGVLGTLDHNSGGAMLGGGGHHEGEGALGGGEGASSTDAAMLHGFTVFDFLPPAWKEMHFKLLKDITAVSPQPVAEFACRRAVLLPGAPVGPTLELRSAGGRELYMRVGVSTAEIQGEIVHIIKMARSSLSEALAERRLRMSISAVDGLITAVESGNSSQLFGLEAGKLVGRGLWEILEEPMPPPAPAGAPAAAGGGGGGRASTSILAAMRTPAGLINRALRYPEHSWRVEVVPPPSRAGRSSFTPITKPAIMQVHVGMSPDDDETCTPSIFVELWPVSGVVGVLDLDHSGRIRAVLEERTRPAGLLFGVPSKSLVGCHFGELVALPTGRTKPGDLLFLNAMKKSSLKSQAKEASVKVGPVHLLRGTHVDARPLSLDVQVIGKPGSKEPCTAIIRVHQKPMIPKLLPAPVDPMVPQQAAAAPPPPKGPTFSIGAAGAMKISFSSVGGGGDEVVLREPAGLLAPVGSGVGGVRSSAITVAFAAPLQRTPSLEDSKPRASSPWCPPAGAGAPQQDPPIVRALSTPPAAKTGNGTPSATQFTLPEYTTVVDAGISTDCGPPPSEVTMKASANGSGAQRAVSTPLTDSSSGQAAQEAGRSKLADLVKSVGGGDGGGGSGRERMLLGQQQRLAASGGGDGCGGREASLAGSGLRVGTPPMPRAGTSLGGAGGGGRLSLAKAGTAGSAVGVIMKIPGAILQTGYLGEGQDGEVDEEGTRGDGGAAMSDAASDSDRGGAGRSNAQESQPRAQTVDRVADWVASKGAYYQTDTILSDSAKACTYGQGSDRFRCRNSEGVTSMAGGGGNAPPTAFTMVPRSPLSEAAVSRPGTVEFGGGGGFGRGRSLGDDMGAGFEAPTPPPMEDDAGSDGGQSAVSGAQSATGSEYTRGKRFRKLAKLMDSSQTQQVQKRLRIHALLTVAVLATVHIICFVLTVTAIKSQQASMTQLGRSGQAQLYMHRIMIDTRSLDIISHNKWLPNLYTPDNVTKFVARIANDAEEVKIRFNEILNTHSKNPDIIRLLYQTKRTVWDTNDADGSDVYTNLTIWDFATRFYSMAKQLEQNHKTWVDDGIFIADSYSGQFLLKSGPDLFIDSRQILDALLYGAVDNSRRVDVLQIVFLIVEGAAISFIAACYLMYLLRAVAAQRFKLYSTFLVIPVGLTRALASQNTSLLVDEDDSDDEDGDDDRTTVINNNTAQEDDDDDDGAATPKLRRRAVLKVDESGEPAVELSPMPSAPSGSSPFVVRRAVETRISAFAADDPAGRKPPYMDRYDKYDKQQAQRTMTGDSAGAESAGGHAGCCWGLFSRLGWRNRFRSSVRRSSIMPLSLSSPILASLGSSKRSLRFDSHETVYMLLPFVVWSIMVITFYAIAVVRMQGVDDVVAIHSVVNFMAARTSRTVFFCQELANVDRPEDLTAKRAALLKVIKLIRDAWYTLQLGYQAYTAVGNNAERFPLVRDGLSHASKALTELFYSSGFCHRSQETGPCEGSNYRFYQVSHTGLDSMMQQLMISLSSMATNSSMVPEGLEDEHFDFVYNVGYKDLLDGTRRIAEAHYDTILALFNSILLAHIVLFLLFWIIFAGFIFFMLNPLLARVSQERRRIAELMSQLPLELDVEKLVARALGTVGPNANGGNGGGGGDERTISGGGNCSGGGGDFDGGTNATSKWKAIIKASSSLTGKGSSMDGRKR